MFFYGNCLLNENKIHRILDHKFLSQTHIFFACTQNHSHFQTFLLTFIEAMLSYKIIFFKEKKPKKCCSWNELYNILNFSHRVAFPNELFENTQSFITVRQFFFVINDTIDWDFSWLLTLSRPDPDYRNVSLKKTVHTYKRISRCTQIEFITVTKFY